MSSLTPLYVVGAVYPFVQTKVLRKDYGFVMERRSYCPWDDEVILLQLKAVALRCVDVQSCDPANGHVYRFETVDGGKKLQSYSDDADRVAYLDVPSLEMSKILNDSSPDIFTELVDGRRFLSELYSTMAWDAESGAALDAITRANRKAGLTMIRDMLHWQFEVNCNTPVRVYRRWRVSENGGERGGALVHVAYQKGHPQYEPSAPRSNSDGSAIHYELVSAR